MDSPGACCSRSLRPRFLSLWVTEKATPPACGGFQNMGIAWSVFRDGSRRAAGCRDALAVPPACELRALCVEVPLAEPVVAGVSLRLARCAGQGLMPVQNNQGSV